MNIVSALKVLNAGHTVSTWYATVLNQSKVQTQIYQEHEVHEAQTA